MTAEEERVTPPAESEGGGEAASRPAWLRRFVRMVSSGTATEPALSAEDLQLQVEKTLLGGPRRYTRAELTELVDVDPQRFVSLWRSLGFAEVPADDVFFTDGDRKAMERLERLRESGLAPEELEEAVTRSVAMAMATLADWQVEMIYEMVGYGHRSVEDQQLQQVSDQVVPLLREMQTYVWRRHLAAAAGRLMTSLPEDSETRSLVVGFADMVEFTKATRQLAPGELTVLIEQFQSAVSNVIANGNGRVVKTVGDEILFVADDPGTGAEIALTLLDEVAKSATVPQLRIGLAVGPVVTRFGDVYGEAVNIAARLTTNTRPGRILVDRNLAASLEHDHRYQLRFHRPLAVRGYRHLQPWGLQRAL